MLSLILMIVGYYRQCIAVVVPGVDACSLYRVQESPVYNCPDVACMNHGAEQVRDARAGAITAVYGCSLYSQYGLGAVYTWGALRHADMCVTHPQGYGHDVP